VSINVFEAAAGSVTEEQREQRIATDKLAAAVYDVKDRFGQFLFAARDARDLHDRMALCKDDMIKTVEPHLFPRTGVMRRICKQIEREFKQAADAGQPGTQNAPGSSGNAYDTVVQAEQPGGATVGELQDTFFGTASRRSADVVDTDETFRPSDGPLVPEGDFRGYLDSVDQDAPAKVDGLFVGEGTEHDESSDNFVKPKESAVRHFAAWCRQKGVKPNLDSLDRYGSRVSDRDYFTIAAALQRQSDMEVSPTADAGSFAPTPAQGLEAMGGPTAPTNPVGDVAAQEAMQQLTGRRHTAAPDYLQKADQALTDLLNQRAEEFQTTIAPLQQALQVVQQAEQEQQAANPFNVMPGGSINVMPPGPGQGDPAAMGADPGMGAPPTDPAMGGGMPPMDPAMMGADPSMGAGAPPMDPSMMGGPADQGQLPPELQQQMMLQGKRGGSPKAPARKGTPARTADVRLADVLKQWQEWNIKRPQKGGLPTGGEVDYDTFAKETGAGQRAIQKLRKHLEGQPVGVTATRKQAWMGWGPNQPGSRKVAGFDWDEHLNGYIAHAPGRFACECGNQIATPSGFQRCACGKQYNSYVIGTGGDRHEASAEKYLVREIPVREGVIVASRKMAGPEYRRTDPETFAKGDKVQHLSPSFHGKGVVHDVHPERGVGVTWNDEGGFGGEPHQTWEHPGDLRSHRRTSNRRMAGPDGEDWHEDDPDTHGAVNEAEADKDDKHEKGSSRDFARFVAEAYAAREAALHDITEPGEVGDGEASGTPTMKPMPEDWARRNPDGKWNKGPRRQGGMYDDDYEPGGTSDDFNSPAAGREYEDPYQQNGWKMTRATDEGHASWVHPSGHEISGQDGLDGGSWQLFDRKGPIGKPHTDPGALQDYVNKRIGRRGRRAS